MTVLDDSWKEVSTGAHNTLNVWHQLSVFTLASEAAKIRNINTTTSLKAILQQPNAKRIREFSCMFLTADRISSFHSKPLMSTSKLLMVSLNSVKSL